MDTLFIQGIAATVSAIIVFVGSVWLLLALVLGPRLAYFVAASVTLAFLLIMGVVWSIGTPLGPVGELPSWNVVGVAEDAAAIEFAPIDEYPEGGGWRAPNPELPDDQAKVGELEGEALEVLEEAIANEEVTVFANTQQATVDSEATRLLEQDDVVYGAVAFEAVRPERQETGEADTPEADLAPEIPRRPPGDPPAETEYADPGATAIAVLRYDPGNPLGKARLITAGTFVLLVGHLLGLSLSERRSRRTA